MLLLYLAFTFLPIDDDMHLSRPFYNCPLIQSCYTGHGQKLEHLSRSFCDTRDALGADLLGCNCSIPDPQLVWRIVSQVEFCLSDKNLAKDAFLHQHQTADVLQEADDLGNLPLKSSRNLLFEILVTTTLRGIPTQRYWVRACCDPGELKGSYSGSLFTGSQDDLGQYFFFILAISLFKPGRQPNTTQLLTHLRTGDGGGNWRGKGKETCRLR
ncbi:uncharacterized protein LOC141917393 isoform X1 [Strix aluco]|uniref:uncharacterized protein LOC141917393 isoform X1 n=1 Tax=Strix aluco TaxID=111821 RepID=UPI003DA2A0BB